MASENLSVLCRCKTRRAALCAMDNFRVGPTLRTLTFLHTNYLLLKNLKTNIFRVYSIVFFPGLVKAAFEVDMFENESVCDTDCINLQCCLASFFYILCTFKEFMV
jgi:hypothetical protein